MGRKSTLLCIFDQVKSSEQTIFNFLILSKSRFPQKKFNNSYTYCFVQKILPHSDLFILLRKTAEGLDSKNFIFLCLLISLSQYSSLFLSVYQSLPLSNYLVKFIYVCLFLSFFLCLNLSLFLSIYLILSIFFLSLNNSIPLSPSICLSVYQNTYLFRSLLA